jgi:hypothetical protein
MQALPSTNGRELYNDLMERWEHIAMQSLQPCPTALEHHEVSLNLEDEKVRFVRMLCFHFTGVHCVSCCANPSCTVQDTDVEKFPLTASAA